MKKTLLQRLISRIPQAEYYPTKHKKQERKEATYIHISNHYIEKKDENGVVSIHRIGITYRKGKEK